MSDARKKAEKEQKGKVKKMLAKMSKTGETPPRQSRKELLGIVKDKSDRRKSEKQHDDAEEENQDGEENSEDDEPSEHEMQTADTSSPKSPEKKPGVSRLQRNNYNLRSKDLQIPVGKNKSQTPGKSQAHKSSAIKGKSHVKGTASKSMLPQGDSEDVKKGKGNRKNKKDRK